MKIKFVISLFIISSLMSISQDWDYRSVPGFGGPIYTAYFVNQDVGWVGCMGGFVFMTQDGGESWVDMESPIDYWLEDNVFVNENVGYFVGGISNIGIVLKTYNAGEDWIVDTVSESSMLTTVCFVNDSVGWVAGKNGVVFKTQNGGQNWEEQITPINDEILKIDFVDSSNGWAVGDNGKIISTKNGGVSWFEQNSTVLNWLSEVCFVDTLSGWASGYQGTLLKTIDGGEEWLQLDNPCLSHIEGLFFHDKSNGWAAGDSLMYTSDGGTTWVNNWNASSIMDIYFTDENNGWAANLSGEVYFTHNGNFMLNSEIIINQHFEIYPQPCNNLLTVSTDRKNVKIQIIDVYGKVLIEKSDSSSNRVDLDVSNLNSGIYFLHTISKNNTFSQKIIIN